MRVELVSPAGRAAGASRGLTTDARNPRLTPGARPAAGFVVAHPRYRAWLDRGGLTTAAAFLDLPGDVVGGHPDRHVARVVVRGRVAYLKREHAVGWRVRLKNWRAGFGWVSRSEREAATLRRLEAAGLPGPQWLAYGADGRGRAFLLVDDLAGAADLRAALRDASLSAADRRTLAERAGRAVAELHEAGFGTPELAAKHLFTDPRSGAVTLIDWQSAGRPGPVPAAARARWLAALAASLADDLASPADRARFLWAYLRTVRAHRRAGPRFGAFARAVRSHMPKQAGRSSVRDQRPPAVPQRLVWLAGTEEAVAVPELAAVWPTPAAVAPFYPDPSDDHPGPAQEWVTFPDGRRGLLRRFTSVDPVGRLGAVLRGRPWRSPGATAARVLFHLERHGVPGPRLLGFGQRLVAPLWAESFVLSDPPAGAAPTAGQRDLLWECGGLLRRLHDAGCRMAPGEPLFVAGSGGVAVASPFAVRLCKRLTDGDRRADLRRLVRRELVGLSRADRLRVVRGYVGRGAVPPAFRSLVV